MGVPDRRITLDHTVMPVPDPRSPVPPGTHYTRILALCGSGAPVVAQLASALDLPAGLTAALVTVLRDDGLVTTESPTDATQRGSVSTDLLRRVRKGLRAI
ncbi:DUF742 domain-containing protein [Streptomyces sp. NPDC003860]